ncbi:UV-stimulated scaffold protein A [Phytophthora citrophthora]|uniref:UV-stimulated scaffold protein A n=1 Tax=Phytophthora citrophthora TaxID=4793 RepID=A0AAD9GM08_9STRA|nr:UV-stimulated scaffold protein A [Phytophthora citrophthora]
MQRGRDGLEALNSENEAARFDQALNGYFRVSIATGKRPRGRGRRFVAPQATENDTETTPEVCLKQIKRSLRDAAAPVQTQYIQRFHGAILHQLKRSKTSFIVFTRALDLCQEIFKRSVAFRTLITKQTASFFDQLLLAAGESISANASRKLRARNQGSKQLTLVLKLIETWKQDFGDRYPSLVAGYGVLVERGYEFPHERARQQEQREREVDTQRHRERVINVKRQQRDREMNKYVPEMEQVLVEMNRVFEILVPTLDAFHVEENSEEEKAPASDPKQPQSGELDEEEEDDDDEIQWEDAGSTAPGGYSDEGVEWESVATETGLTRDNVSNDVSDDETVNDEMDINDIVQAYGLGSSSYQLTIEVSKQVCEESSENDALFKSLADGALRMRKRFLPLLSDWEQHSLLTQSAGTSSAVLQTQREVLQRIRDLRDRMTRALLKLDDLVQDSKKPKQDTSSKLAVVSLPLDAYNLPTKRRRKS